MTGDSNIEVVLRAIHETLGDDTIAAGLFNLADGSVGAGRRVLWVPTRFICDNNKQATLHGGNLFTESLAIEAHIYGDSFADACTIRLQLLNASRKTLGTGQIAVDGLYKSEITEEGAVLWSNLAHIVQRFTWNMNAPIVEDNVYSARVERIDLLDGTQFSAADGALTPSEQLEITEQD
jgi:hypothetical protein